MTDKFRFPANPDDAAPMIPGMVRRITRRGMIGTTLATALAAPAFAQTSQPAAAPAANAPTSAVIDVNRARTAPIPIAIPAFAGGTSAGDLVGVISNDLNNCGLFRIVDGSGVAGTPAGGAPDFDAWKGTGAQALITGSITQNGDQLRVEFRLWDILPGTQLQGTAYTTGAANWRRIAHIIADVVYQRLLGEKGYFDTRIAYISTTGPGNNPTKRLAIMDQDGANNRFLTDGSWTALGPRFSPTRDQIAFISYINKAVRVYLFDLGTGTRSLVGNFRTMTFAPPLQPGWQRDRHVALSEWRLRHHHLLARWRRRTDADQRRLHRQLPLLQPGWQPDRLRIGSRRRPAALCHGRRRVRRAADQLRRRPLRRSGLVAARRPHRLHPARRHFRHRRHGAGRLG